MDSNSNNRNLGGRPTKYDARYCEDVIEHLKLGKSLASFASSIEVSIDTVNEWRKVHEEFSAACSIAMTHCQEFWEEQGIINLENPKGFNDKVWMFFMKNRFKDYREKKEIIEESKQNVTHGVSEELTETTKELIEVLKEWKKS